MATNKLPVCANKTQEIWIKAFVKDTDRNDKYPIGKEIEFSGDEVNKIIKTLKFNWKDAECYKWMDDDRQALVRVDGDVSSELDEYEQFDSFKPDENTSNQVEIEISDESDGYIEIRFHTEDQNYSFTPSDNQATEATKWFLSLKCLDPKILDKNQKLLERMFKEWKKKNKYRVEMEIR